MSTLALTLAVVYCSSRASAGTSGESWEIPSKLKPYFSPAVTLPGKRRYRRSESSTSSSV